MATDNDKAFYDELWRQSMLSGCGTYFYSVIIICAILLFCGCGSKRQIEYVDREVVRYETKIIHDSVSDKERDSVYVIITQKGDTVCETKYREKTRYRDRLVLRTDTLWRDSIHVMVRETTVEKQKNPKWCYYSLAVCVLFIIFAIIKTVRFVKWH